MEKQYNLETGKIGENFAKEYLKKKGYNIIEQNYRSKYAEIDLIAKEKKELVFVEVRTKRGEMFGTPEETLNKRKLRKLWLNARAYAGRIHWQDAYRIDAVCIILNLDNSLARLNHYQNII
jgi:putative endonuclease